MEFLARQMTKTIDWEDEDAVMRRIAFNSLHNYNLARVTSSDSTVRSNTKTNVSSSSNVTFSESSPSFIAASRHAEESDEEVANAITNTPPVASPTRLDMNKFRFRRGGARERDPEVHFRSRDASMLYNWMFARTQSPTTVDFTADEQWTGEALFKVAHTHALSQEQH
eukprot:739051-Rhodomonas_salina.3